MCKQLASEVRRRWKLAIARVTCNAMSGLVTSFDYLHDVSQMASLSSFFSLPIMNDNEPGSLLPGYDGCAGMTHTNLIIPCYTPTMAVSKGWHMMLCASTSALLWCTASNKVFLRCRCSVHTGKGPDDALCRLQTQIWQLVACPVLACECCH